MHKNTDQNVIWTNIVIVFIDINLHNKSAADVCHFFKHHYLK